MSWSAMRGCRVWLPVTRMPVAAMMCASLWAAGCALLWPGPAAGASLGAWQRTGPLRVGVENPTLTLLQSGDVLLAGGSRAGGSSAAETHGTTDAAEIYNPVQGKWSTTASMLTPRVLHTATLLPSGEVLVTGGEGISGSGLASAELYDPLTRTWSAIANPMEASRAGQMATLLPSGEVLIVGGNLGVGPSAELYDPGTGEFSATGAMPSGVDPAFGTATPLESGMDAGEVLVTGGLGPLSAAELYDPSTNSWTATGSLLTARDLQTATQLPSGEVLIAGGYNTALGVTLSSAELYDPATGAFSATGSMILPRWEPSAVSLASGEVLVAGGSLDAPSAELYDPTSGTWNPTAPMVRTRLEQKAVLLPSSGEVLVAGGDLGDPENSLSSAEVFDPQAPMSQDRTAARRSAHEHAARRHPHRG